MIYRARHNYFLYSFFQFYSVWKIRRNFHRVDITGEFIDKGFPVLIVSNHISWWDGFWVVFLNRKLFKRKYFFFMMLEEQLKKHMFFNRTGGYSIRKRSKSIIESIDYTSRLLTDNKNLVLIFPQGGINSLHTREIRFEKGLEHIIRRTAGRIIHLIFLVNLVDYYSCPKPSLFMYIMEYKGERFDSDTMEAEYNRFYNECVIENIKKATEE